MPKSKKPTAESIADERYPGYYWVRLKKSTLPHTAEISMQDYINWIPAYWNGNVWQVLGSGNYCYWDKELEIHEERFPGAF